MQSSSEIRIEARSRRLLELLANGHCHSREYLAQQLSISRRWISKLIKSLRALGVPVESIPYKGYRLPQPVILLDRAAIFAAISEEVGQHIECLDVLFSIDSTNLYLSQRHEVPAGRLQVCLAEMQRAGRGRRGRSWIAPFGGGLCISFGWRFAQMPPAFSALGLAVATAVVRALSRFGAKGIGVKWPNDLLWQKRKLAGILIETRGEPHGSMHVVIGVGINVDMLPSVRSVLTTGHGLPISDLTEILLQGTPTRNQLAAAMVDEIAQMLQIFSITGFTTFAPQWRALDVLVDSKVEVISIAEAVVGIARGVELDGNLLLEVDGQTRSFSCGEVSLRSSE